MRIETCVYVDIIDFGYLVIQKAVVELLIGLIARVIAVKMVMIETLVIGVVNIDRNNIHGKMALMRQSTKDC